MEDRRSEATTWSRSCSRTSKTARRVAAAAAMAACLLSGTSAHAAEETPLRWDVEETPYAERGWPRKAASNVRDGTIGVIDSFAQGASAGFELFSPRRGGLFTQKVSTIAGDLVGLVDDNPATKYVFKGIASRQLLRFGALAEPAPTQIAMIFDTEFDAIPKTTYADYVGPEYFHTRAYKTPSVVAGITGTAFSSLVVRPVGGLAVLFGFRDSGERLDGWGVDLVGRSLAVPFF